MTENAASRGNDYAKSAKEKRLIAKAIVTGYAKYLIIFKSHLPTSYKRSGNLLLRKLEIEFAENIFKTYPSNPPDCLNYDPPGKNASRRLVLDRDEFIHALAKNYSVLTPDKFDGIIKSENYENVQDLYKSYLLAYEKYHPSTWKREFLKLNQNTATRLVFKEIKSIDELNDIVKDFPRKRRNNLKSRWKNYHKNHLNNITEDYTATLLTIDKALENEEFCDKLNDLDLDYCYKQLDDSDERYKLYQSLGEEGIDPLFHMVELFPKMFDGCTSLKSITIPNSVTLIGDYAFYGCDDLLITFTGTKQQWKALVAGTKAFQNATYECSCTDGALKKGK
jgi:hypothetical protein